MKTLLLYSLISVLAITPALAAEDKPAAASPADAPKNASALFNDLADTALQAMTKKAEELKIKGVAVVAFIEGDTVKSWSSKMTVVGTLKNAPSGNNRGANLLGIVYSKAAEMAETLKDSGSGVRPPMTGETGWQGGLIKKCKGGYVIGAFSGGPSEKDLQVARVGLEILAEKL